MGEGSLLLLFRRGSSRTRRLRAGRAYLGQDKRGRICNLRQSQVRGVFCGNHTAVQRPRGEREYRRIVGHLEASNDFSGKKNLAPYRKVRVSDPRQRTRCKARLGRSPCSTSPESCGYTLLERILDSPVHRSRIAVAFRCRTSGEGGRSFYSFGGSKPEARRVLKSSSKADQFFKVVQTR